MIVLGGSSMHKGANSWQAGRAIACLPALTGNLGIPGGGFGPRHGSSTHGQALANIFAEDMRPPGDYLPSQMARMTEAFATGRIQVLLLFGTNMLSSFADANALAAGLARVGLVVSHDLFMNDTARRYADIVLPGTAWLEELGCKMTNTHLYLMEQALAAPGETRSLTWILRALAQRLDLPAFFPWPTEEAMIDAISQPSRHRACHGGVAPRPGRHRRAAHLARGASRPALRHPLREGGVLFCPGAGTGSAAFASL